MKTPITENKNFIALLNGLTANMPDDSPIKDIQLATADIVAKSVQSILSEIHKKEMIEFDMWKTELFAEDDLACFNCGKWLKWNDDKNCWIEYTPEELLKLFRKERGNE